MKLKAKHLFVLISLPLITIYYACEKEDTTEKKDPVAVLSVTPTSGTTATIFSYDASKSHDGNNNNTELLYRFDFNNDNIWDIDWTYESKFNNFYPQEGSYTAVLEVKNIHNLVSSDLKVINIDKEPSNLPEVETYPAKDISHHYASYSGKLTHKGGSDIYRRGFYYKTNGDGEIWLDIAVETSLDTFSQTMTNLIQDSLYYVKAFATNSYGTGFGEVLSFVTDGRAYGEPCAGIETVTDERDGSVYGTVQMGDQCWLNRNMNINIGSNTCYNNIPDNCLEYGRLYDWETAVYACPSGFRLPTLDEIGWLRFEVADAVELKSSEGWFDGNNGTNISGFNAKPGGFQIDPDNYYHLTQRSVFWTSDEAVSGIWFALINYDDLKMDIDYTLNSWSEPAMPVRCIKDE